MVRCPAITRSGQPCQGLVRPGNDHCPSHDPARAEARKKAASKAGRSRAGGEIYDVKTKLRKLADDVLAGRVSPGVGSVVSQVLGTVLKAVEAEARLRETAVREGELALKVREQEELQSEVQELRELVEQQTSSTRRGGGSWAG